MKKLLTIALLVSAATCMAMKKGSECSRRIVTEEEVQNAQRKRMIEKHMRWYELTHRKNDDNTLEDFSDEAIEDIREYYQTGGSEPTIKN